MFEAPVLYTLSNWAGERVDWPVDHPIGNAAPPTLAEPVAPVALPPVAVASDVTVDVITIEPPLTLTAPFEPVDVTKTDPVFAFTFDAPDTACAPLFVLILMTTTYLAEFPCSSLAMMVAGYLPSNLADP